MSYLTEGSERSMLTEGNLFYVPSTLSERIATHGVYIGPSAATFDEANDILFEIAQSTDLISLADIRFECELFILKADGQASDLSHSVCPTNSVLGSLFQSVTVEVAGRSTSDDSS